jgi:acetyl esterase/lipase
MSWLILTAAAVLAFIALWIVVPAPMLWLIALSILASEFSLLLLPAPFIVGAAAWRFAAGGIRIAAVLLCALAAILLALPIAQYPSGVPLSIRRLLSGLTSTGARVERNVAIDTASTPLRLDVYRPSASGAHPILVQIYGGAWRGGEPSDDTSFAKYLASRGYLVFGIDYRHAPASHWPDQIDDVRAALTWIRAHANTYDGDSSRLALLGRSSGAQLAMIAALTDPGVSAVIDYYGPVDLARGWREPPSPDPIHSRSVLENFLGGTPDQMADRYADASPIHHIGARVPPSLLIYGARDHIVQIKFGRALHDALIAAGARSQLVELPWSDHAFDLLPGGLGGQVALWHVERFLDATLLHALDRRAGPDR